LQKAIAWLAKEIPKSEHGLKSVQAAAYCVTEAAENNGPDDLCARMGMIVAAGVNPHFFAGTLRRADASRHLGWPSVTDQ
jgi:hypothetical protein